MLPDQYFRCPPCLQVGFYDDDDIGQLREVLVPGLHLVDADPNALFNRLRFQVRIRQCFQRQFLAVFAATALDLFAYQLLGDQRARRAGFDVQQ